MRRLIASLTVGLCLLIGSFASATDTLSLSGNQDLLLRLSGAADHADPAVLLGLSVREQLEELTEHADGTGLVHTRYVQTIDGVPVWGHQTVISRDLNGAVRRLHGTLVQGLNRAKLDLEPMLDAQSALIMAEDLAVGDAFDAGDWFFENETSELMVYADGFRPVAVYVVSFFADVEKGGRATRPTYLIDARDGSVHFQYEGLTTADGTGPGGNLKTGQYHYGTDYPAFPVTQSGSSCTMQTSNVRAVNLNHGTSGSTAFSYSCYVNTFKSINGAYSPINDAYSFGLAIFDMYQDWYGTAPLSFQLQMRVHYSTNYQNAFWNGTSMTFGDGGSTFYPLVSLDVSSHEVAHGFTEQNSGLIYSGQSGGINEAFSDMAGEAAEYYLRGSNDFLVGAEIFKASGALRYMNNPPLDGRSIDSADDYTSGMDVHYSSGVYNKAFYVLASKPGWNTRKAFNCFVRANQNYWTPSTNFVSGAQGVRDAAGDLGYCEQDVVAAFAAVDVSITGAPCSTSGRVPLYRYNNQVTRDHFYTTNYGELGAGGGNWKYEGIQCYVYPSNASGRVPLYRYYNKTIGDHFYTTNYGELGAGGGNWKYEGIQCYVYAGSASGRVPLYRYYSQVNGDHFYTTNYGELGAGGGNWKYEGIQCYVFTN